jgi:hypothetical protein
MFVAKIGANIRASFRDKFFKSIALFDETGLSCSGASPRLQDVTNLSTIRPPVPASPQKGASMAHMVSCALRISTLMRVDVYAAERDLPGPANCHSGTHLRCQGTSLRPSGDVHEKTLCYDHGNSCPFGGLCTDVWSIRPDGRRWIGWFRFCWRGPARLWFARIRWLRITGLWLARVR